LPPKKKNKNKKQDQLLLKFGNSLPLLISVFKMPSFGPNFIKIPRELGRAVTRQSKTNDLTPSNINADQSWGSFFVHT
jgi:hypothetical protein